MRGVIINPGWTELTVMLVPSSCKRSESLSESEKISMEENTS